MIEAREEKRQEAYRQKRQEAKRQKRREAYEKRRQEKAALALLAAHTGELAKAIDEQ